MEVGKREKERDTKPVHVQRLPPEKMARGNLPLLLLSITKHSLPTGFFLFRSSLLLSKLVLPGSFCILFTRRAASVHSLPLLLPYFVASCLPLSLSLSLFHFILLCLLLLVIAFYYKSHSESVELKSISLFSQNHRPLCKRVPCVLPPQ